MNDNNYDHIETYTTGHFIYPTSCFVPEPSRRSYLQIDNWKIEAKYNTLCKMIIVLCSQPGTDKYCKVSIDTSVELQANIEKYTSNRFEKVTQ